MVSVTRSKFVSHNREYSNYLKSRQQQANLYEPRMARTPKQAREHEEDTLEELNFKHEES